MNFHDCIKFFRTQKKDEGSHYLKIAQNVAFEFKIFGILYQFLSYLK